MSVCNEADLSVDTISTVNFYWGGGYTGKDALIPFFGQHIWLEEIYPKGNLTSKLTKFQKIKVNLFNLWAANMTAFSHAYKQPNHEFPDGPEEAVKTWPLLPGVPDQLLGADFSYTYYHDKKECDHVPTINPVSEDFLAILRGIAPKDKPWYPGITAYLKRFLYSWPPVTSFKVLFTIKISKGWIAGHETFDFYDAGWVWTMPSYPDGKGTPNKDDMITSIKQLFGSLLTTDSVGLPIIKIPILSQPFSDGRAPNTGGISPKWFTQSDPKWDKYHNYYVNPSYGQQDYQFRFTNATSRTTTNSCHYPSILANDTITGKTQFVAPAQYNRAVPISPQDLCACDCTKSEEGLPLCNKYCAGVWTPIYDPDKGFPGDPTSLNLKIQDDAVCLKISSTGYCVQSTDGQILVSEGNCNSPVTYSDYKRNDVLYSSSKTCALAHSATPTKGKYLDSCADGTAICQPSASSTAMTLSDCCNKLKPQIGASCSDKGAWYKENCSGKSGSIMALFLFGGMIFLVIGVIAGIVVYLLILRNRRKSLGPKKNVVST